MSHLKAYAAPKSWAVKRKTNKWILRPAPGTHPLQKAMPIGLLLKQLECACNTKETKIILNNKAVMVDGRIVKDLHFNIGFMDAIRIKPGINVRGALDKKGRLSFKKAPEGEMNKKICRITGKTTMPKGKIQLNLSDGRNITPETKNYTTGDSLLIEVPSQKIIEHLPLEKGSTAFLIGGRHTGSIVKIEEVKNEKVICKNAKNTIESLKKFAFVIGKDKPAIEL